MDNEIILKKIEEVFKSLGFEAVTIHGTEFMQYKNCYCRVTYLTSLNAFVIESADDIQDAEKGILEDGDLYYTDVPENKLLRQIRSDLINYYMDD